MLSCLKHARDLTRALVGVLANFAMVGRGVKMTTLRNSKTKKDRKTQKKKRSGALYKGFQFYLSIFS